MKIGNYEIETPVIFAPMAGYSDRAFRTICKRLGADLVFTEFVSSEGIVRGSEKTESYLDYDDIERPLGIQIFGHDPVAMANSAKMIEEKFQPDVIDINMGCSVKKVVAKNAGAALLNDLNLLSKIAGKVVKAVKTPVTAKIRSGWNHKNIVAVEVAQILEDQGITTLTIHPRTASDVFSSKPDWNIITEIKRAVDIPVIGNGNIITPFDAKQMLDRTGCDGIMIGRAAIGNPWLFNDIKKYLATGDTPVERPLIDKIQLCKNLINLEIEYRGWGNWYPIMRKFYSSYFKGFPGASQFREQLVKSESISNTLEIIENLEKQIISS